MLCAHSKDRVGGRGFVQHFKWESMIDSTVAFSSQTDSNAHPETKPYTVSVWTRPQLTSAWILPTAKPIYALFKLG